ncbi:hypothetical protein FACS1894201_03480 [Bacteroidia bacterium]|nr:hypothetical protein FACS1894201_03480 [Bacteroidia bacterium]
MRRFVKIVFLGIALCAGANSSKSVAQNIRIENLKDQFSWKNMAKMNGGLSLNGVYLQAGDTGVNPFTWVLSANLNGTLFGMVNLPITFTLNNLSHSYTYPHPPERFSMHPSYKWVTAHIGDVSMTLSPYTMSGFMFTGGGIELNPPNSPMSVAAGYGRMVKATEYNPDNLQNVPAFRRMGGGAKIGYKMNKLSIGGSLFAAKDDPYSLLQIIPKELNIVPQNNIAWSVNTTASLIKHLSLSAEYGMSLLATNTTANNTDALSAASNAKTVYDALNMKLSYQLQKNTFGIGYERIDPQYHSLGGYFFTNDLENLTFNFARPFLKDRMTFSTNIGVQQDDLDNHNKDKTQRLVGAINMGFAQERFNTALSYSNFQSYTNKKDQFAYINQTTDYENLDTLNFRQLSQNAMVMLGYTLSDSKERKQTVSVNLNFQETANPKENEARSDVAMQTYNVQTAYNVVMEAIHTQLSAAFNVSYSDAQSLQTLQIGPLLTLSRFFFDKTLQTTMLVSYNNSTNNGISTGAIVNARLNTAYTLKKRNRFLLSLSEQLRNIPQNDTTKKRNIFSVSFTYSVAF